MSGRIRLYGVEIDAVTMAQALTWVDQKVKEGDRGRIVTLNVTGLMQAEQQPFFKSYVAEADLVVADGQPLVWLAPRFGGLLPERVAGIDLVDALAAQAAERGHGIFLLGSTTDTVEWAAEALASRHPGLEVSGTHHGYFHAGADVARLVADSGANILLVGMGSPRQERFIHDHWADLGVNVAIGVGGTFDVLAGRLRRAPVPVQAAGLEWVFRMLQEPRRLGPRYLATLWWLCRRTVRPR